MVGRTRMLRGLTAVAVGATAVAVGIGPAGAGGYGGDGGPKSDPKGGHEAEVSAPLADGLAGPLQIDVSGRKVLVGQSFSGTVSAVDRNGTSDLFNEPGVDGVAFGPFGSIVYTYSDFENGVKEIRLRTRSGETRTIADVGAYEESVNPDQGNTYGLLGLSEECAASLPPDAGLLPYSGIVDSHPYALALAPGGMFVAEAGGNDILFVTWWGDIRTVAVLPAQPPVEVTPEAAAANELPPCVAGSQFVAEPVPTDVEIGRDGMLYVSSLPGGPEDPSLGARGSVYKVNPWSGRTKLVATGFAGATNLALSPSGTIYVSELFGGQISKVTRNGGHTPVATVDTPAALEWSNGRLVAGIEAFGSGKIVTIQP